MFNSDGKSQYIYKYINTYFNAYICLLLCMYVQHNLFFDFGGRNRSLLEHHLLLMAIWKYIFMLSFRIQMVFVDRQTSKF